MKALAVSSLQRNISWTLCVLLCLLSPVVRGDIRRRKLALQDQTSNQIIDSFLFAAGGWINAELSDVTQTGPLPGNPLLLFVCSESDIQEYLENRTQGALPSPLVEKQFTSDLCSQSENDVCRLLPPVPVSPNAPVPSYSTSYQVPTTARMFTILIQCSPAVIFPLARNFSDPGLVISGNYVLSFTNPGLFFFRYLDLLDRNNALLKLSFAILWVIMSLIWIFSQLQRPKTRMYTLLTIIAISRILYLAQSFGFGVYLGTVGVSDQPVIVHLPDALAGLSSMFLYIFLALISKGYTIYRLYLSPAEIRAVIFVGVSMGVGDAVFSYNNSSILLVIFSISAYVYMFNQMRMHLEVYAIRVAKIRNTLESDNGEPDVRLVPVLRVVDPIPERPWYRFTSFTAVVHGGTRIVEPLPDAAGLHYGVHEKSWDALGPYYARLWMMCMVQRVITYFLSTAVLVRLAMFLDVFKGSGMSFPIHL
ncbi:MAG: hypothetical protein SGCHY_004350 [Lobulomycetales sp.]